MGRNLKRKLILAFLVILLSLYTATLVYAQGKTPDYPTDNDVNQIAKKLYCPVCPNTPLDVCETQACKDWRMQIRDELTSGWSEQQVIDYFVSQYGERVLAEPLRRGFTSLVWLFPVIAALLGLWLSYEILKGWRARKQITAPEVEDPQISPELLSRIEEEIRKLD
jgi:cytochrome c-type biogenesis protein CcmH